VRRRSHRPVLALAVLVAVMGPVAVACSIDTDNTPRGLVVSTTTTEATASPTSGGASGVLYYVRDGKLVPVSRSLPDRTPNTVITALLGTPEPLERVAGLGSSIPAGTELLGLQIDGDTVEVNLSKDFENVVGTGRQQAIAQMVMTLTEFTEVSAVRFMVDGKPVQVTSPTRGDTTSVGDCDYESLLTTEDEARQADLDVATTQRLAQRRTKLANTCPTPTTARN
jgi:hypothetical protein